MHLEVLKDDSCKNVLKQPKKWTIKLYLTIKDSSHETKYSIAYYKLEYLHANSISGQKITFNINGLGAECLLQAQNARLEYQVIILKIKSLDW